MTTMTSVTVNITRHETCRYEFEGDRCVEDALLMIGEGKHDPVYSNIRSEDVDVVELKVMTS